tara:strand:+ start:4396 stop:4785 length:390 start_codon:yes stop_codon:yes gene_type:complete
MLELHDKVVQSINRSPLLAGICMLILNVGSRYVDLGFSKNQEALIGEKLAREVLILAICFVGTKNIALSIVLTGSFMVLADHVFNDASPYCACPSYFKKFKTAIDKNNDGAISKKEFKAAMQALAKLDQ